MKESQIYDLMYKVGGIYLDHFPEATEADFFIVGSQSVWGKFKPPSREMTVSQELDVIPVPYTDELSSQLEVVLGNMSAHFNAEETEIDVVEDVSVMAPENWKDRATQGEALRRDTLFMDIKFMEPHDLAISKMMRGVEKDKDFVKEMFRCNVLSTSKLSYLLNNEMDQYKQTPEGMAKLENTASTMNRLYAEVQKGNKRVRFNNDEGSTLG